MGITDDFYPNLCSLEVSGHIIQASRKTWRKTGGKKDHRALLCKKEKR